MDRINTSIKKGLLGLTLLLILGLISSACGTATATPTQVPQAEENELTNSPIPPSETLAPAPDTATPSLTYTPLPTFTSTPALLADIIGNTNCRTGPGSVYDLLHTYLTGNQVELLGVSPDGFFWYTRAESEYAPDCWLWSKYVSPQGDTGPLPIYTPPPTPTPSPDFTITYHWADVAAGSWYFFFKIENIGNVAWDSALLYAFDPVVPQDAGRFSNTFLIDGNNTTPTKDSILPGDSGYFHAARLSNPGGYGKQPGVIDFYFIACTEEYLGGYCVTKMWTEDGLW